MIYGLSWPSEVAQCKDLPASECGRHRRLGVRSLGGGDPLEKEMAIHSNILAWKIPWTEEPRGLQFMGSQSRTQTSTCMGHTHTRAQLPSGMWNLPRPGIKPVPLALAGRLATTEPPGMSPLVREGEAQGSDLGHLIIIYY